MQLRNAAQLDPVAQFMPQKSGRAIQAFTRSGYLIGVTQRGEVHLRVCVVGSHLDAGQRDHAYARVLDLKAQKVRQIALYLLRYTKRAGKISGHELRRETSNVRG